VSQKPQLCGVLTRDQDSDDSHVDHWVIYLHVVDLDKELARAKAQGAEILRDPWDVPGVGRIAMLRDPGGAEIGWVTPVPAPTSFNNSVAG